MSALDEVPVGLSIGGRLMAFGVSGSVTGRVIECGHEQTLCKGDHQSFGSGNLPAHSCDLFHCVRSNWPGHISPSSDNVHSLFVHFNVRLVSHVPQCKHMPAVFAYYRAVLIVAGLARERATSNVKRRIHEDDDM